MRGNDELCRWARESLAPAVAMLAGTEHIQRVIGEVLGPGPWLDLVRIVPPGVDVEEFRPRGKEEALAGLLAEAEADPPNPSRRNERLPDEGNAARLARFLGGPEPTVVYVGKLSREKGVHLLVDALQEVDARLVVVGFGDERAALERRAAGHRVLFTGPLEHRHLRHLFALADVAVTPSTFPEAFGMVAAEAAACGAPPLVARHSGLAEIADGLEREYPPELRRLASFENGDVVELSGKLSELLALPERERTSLREAARRAAVERWSWEHVAETILRTCA
jgi:glycosyltransferase involved in cell wall biosynthesis